jgi:hypothetical protein
MIAEFANQTRDFLWKNEIIIPIPHKSFSKFVIILTYRFPTFDLFLSWVNAEFELKKKQKISKDRSIFILVQLK